MYYKNNTHLINSVIFTYTPKKILWIKELNPTYIKKTAQNSINPSRFTENSRRKILRATTKPQQIIGNSPPQNPNTIRNKISSSAPSHSHKKEENPGKACIAL